MPVAIDQFLKSLEDSGIISPSNLRRVREKLPSDKQQDVQEFARELVRQQKLTKFQAQEAFQGKTKNLVLGNYVILDKIGAGGMGQVFKARHKVMERIVAVKMLPAAVTKDRAAVQRFHQEVKAASKLLHPNIVAAFDADQAGGVHFLVMEHVDGQDLSALVKKHGPFSPEKAVDCTLQAARGLEFAHRKGVIHRDIKPANLLSDAEGTVKVLDMGLARLDAAGGPANQAELTGTGTIMGTVDYMAPEQALSTKHADARADIYSLGCTLYYLLAGRAVYDGETLMAKMLAHREQEIPSFREFRDDVPDEVDAVFRKMVAKNVEDRYQSMTEVIADLQTLAGGGSTRQDGTQAAPDHSASNSNLTFLKDLPAQTFQRKAAQTKAASGSGKNDIKRHTLIAAGLAGVIVLLVGMIIIVKNRSGKVPESASVEPSGRRGNQEPGVSNQESGKSDLHQAATGGRAVAANYALAVMARTPYDVWTSSDYEWTPPENLGPVINSASGEASPCLSADGLTLLFDSDRSGGQGKTDLWMSRRATLIAPWSAPENLGATVNSSENEKVPTLSSDGLALLFASDRGQSDRRYKLRWCHRKTMAEPWSTATAQQLEVTAAAGVSDYEPELAADGLSLLFTSFPRVGTHGLEDLWQCRRPKTTDPWGSVQNLGVIVNGSAKDMDPALSSDGRVLLFASDRPGGMGKVDFWWSSRPSLDASWSAPQNLGKPVNSDLDELSPTLSADGQTLLYRSNRPGGRGGNDIWMSRRVLTPAAAARTAASDKFVNSLGMEFVRVPKGKAWLGGGGGKPGTQEVTIPDDFYLGKYEVTQDEWQRVMATKGSNFARNGHAKEAVKDIPDTDLNRFPMDNQTWERCQEFVARLNEKAQESGWVYRLPTEVEWEYACRGGPMIDKAQSALDFYLQQPTNQLPSGQGNLQHGKDHYLGRPCRVGLYPPNRLGLHDMHGNISEWCQDTVVDEKGASQHVHRGGHWFSHPAQSRTAFREFSASLHQGSNIGLRLARVPAAVNSSPFVSLFNGKDLTGWRQVNPNENGQAEFVVEDGQGILRLTPQASRATPELGNYHLRFDYKAEKGAGGGIHQLVGHLLTFRPELLLTSPPRVQLIGVQCSYQEAEPRNSRVVAIGPRLTNGERLDFKNYALNSRSPWQRIEIVRLDDSCLYLINGQLACALTGIRVTRDGQEKPLGPHAVEFWTDRAPASFRNIEVREITALPPEVLEQAAWQPLFNGKDLTGWTKTNPAQNTGRAEVVQDDGQPALQLTKPFGLATNSEFGDYHLRLQTKTNAGVGGIHHVFRKSIGLILACSVSGKSATITVEVYGATFQEAKMEAGRIAAVGDPRKSPAKITFPDVSASPGWQEIEVLRLDDTFVYVVNGRMAGGITNFRDTRSGQAQPFGATPIELFAAQASPALFRNIEIREITALPPEIGQSEISNLKLPFDVLTSPDHQWSEPENLGPTVNSAGLEGSPFLSADGLTLLFDSNRSGGQGFQDLWMCRRPTLTASWSAPENLGPPVNDKSSEQQPYLRPDGLTLVFASDRGPTPNLYRLWRSTRTTTGSAWSQPKRLDSSIDVAGASDRGAELSDDGLSLYLYSSSSRKGHGEDDLWLCRRQTTTDPWGTPENLGPTVNSAKADSSPALSSDGRVLVFSSDRSGGLGRADLWWCSRSSTDSPWSAPTNLGAPVNSAALEGGATLSADGRTLLFYSDREGGLGGNDIWMTRRVAK